MALGHSHERVGESLRSDRNFGTSGSKKSCFVSKIWLFEVRISVRPDFTVKLRKREMKIQFSSSREKHMSHFFSMSRVKD